MLYCSGAVLYTVYIYNDRFELFGGNIPTSSLSLVYFSQSLIVRILYHSFIILLPSLRRCCQPFGTRAYLHHSLCISPLPLLSHSLSRSLSQSLHPLLHNLFLHIFRLYVALSCHSTHFPTATLNLREPPIFFGFSCISIVPFNCVLANVVWVRVNITHFNDRNSRRQR